MTKTQPNNTITFPTQRFNNGYAASYNGGGVVRLTPQSLEAEQSTLGAMLMEKAAIETVMVMLKPSDFLRVFNQHVYEAILGLHERGIPVDTQTVHDELRRRGHLDIVGGAAYITSLYESCPSAANVEAYATTVLDLACERKRIELGELLQSTAHQNEGSQAAQSIIAQLQALDERSNKGTLPQTGFNLGQLLATQFNSPKWVVPGLLPPGLSIFGGMMKMGKSWMMLSLALAVASGGYWLGSLQVPQGDVLYLGLEDTPLRFQQRAAKLLEGTPQHVIDAMGAHLEFHTQWPRSDQGGASQLDRWLTEHPNARLVVIDVLQKFKPASKGGNYYEEDYAAMGTLKAIADRHNVAIVMVHHMSKKEVDDPFLALSGTVGITGACDAMFALARRRGKNEATLHVDGRDVGSEQKALSWDAQLNTWTLLGDAQEFEERDSRAEVLQLLRRHGSPMSPRDIAVELDRKEGSVRKLLRDMLDDSQVLNPTYGQYSAAQVAAIPPDVEPATEAARVTELPLAPEEQGGNEVTGNSVTLAPEVAAETDWKAALPITEADLEEVGRRTHSDFTSQYWRAPGCLDELRAFLTAWRKTNGTLSNLTGAAFDQSWQQWQADGSPKDTEGHQNGLSEAPS